MKIGRLPDHNSLASGAHDLSKLGVSEAIYVTTRECGQAGSRVGKQS
jgi:hypothetical protein